MELSKQKEVFTSARGARLLTGKVISEGVTAAVAVPDEEVVLHFQGEPL